MLITIKNKIIILELKGDLDIVHSTEFLKFVNAHKDFSTIILDMTVVDFLSSTGIGVLLNLYKNKKTIGIVVSKGSQVESMLTFQHLNEFIDIFYDIDEGCKYLKLNKEEI